MLVSPPSPSSVGWVVGLSSRLSKTPSGMGAQVDALEEFICCRVVSPRNMLQFQGREVFFQLPYVEEVSYEHGLVAATFPADLLDDQLGVPLHEELADPQG